MKHTKLLLVTLLMSLYNTMHGSAVVGPASSPFISWITDMVGIITATFTTCAQCANRCAFNAANLTLLLHQVPTFFILCSTKNKN